MKIKKSIVFIIMVLVGLLLTFASGSRQKIVNIKNIKYLDSSEKPGSYNLTGSRAQGVKPHLDFGKTPLYFIFNKGQVNKKAKFYAKASRYTMWLTKQGLVFDSTHTTPSGHPSQERHTPPFGHPSQEGNYEHLYSPRPTKIYRDVSRLFFLDANKNPEMVPIEVTPLRVNYFKGNDRSKWHCNIPTSQAVLYKSLYKNIDLKVYGIEKQIEYDWIVKAGGDPGDIKFKYKNVKGTRIDEEGNLLIETDMGELVHKKPVSFQEIGVAHSAMSMAQSVDVGAGLRACPKVRRPVNVMFKKIDENTYGFEVGEYDKNHELIIDPVVLAYSTYLGGGIFDKGSGIAVDGSGSAYVTGYTTSPDFPTLNQFQPYQGETDVFVIKLDTTQKGASSLIYSTYLGGEDNDLGKGIAVDGSGNVYVTGYTRSPDFPTLNQFQPYQGGSGYTDAFVTKLDTTQSGASSLIYSTYLGGGYDEAGAGIAVDGSGNAYVTGSTHHSYFPIMNQYQTYQGAGDAFVTKLDTTQSGASCLIYSTYLGGGSAENAYGIAVDGSGNAYVIGGTYSTDFPTLNQYQTYQGESDVFVTKLDTTQSGASCLIYSTYLGGWDDDWGMGIAIDGSGNAYVTGATYSPDFPTLNQYQAYQGAGDVFVTKLDPTQSGASCLIYSTYLGGGNREQGNGIAIDGSGNTYVTGYTESTNFPILNQYQAYQGGSGYDDVFVTKLDTTQSGPSGLIYSTYLGGEEFDHGNGIAVDGSGNAYVTGRTHSPDFPTLNQYQAYQGGGDAFVTKLYSFTPNDFTIPTVTTTAISNITSTTAASGGNVTNNGGLNVTARGVCWSTSPLPTISDNKTTNGKGLGAFASELTGLTENTNYYVRAYATNSKGTAYGEEFEFKTKAEFVTVKITEPEAGAQVSGTVTIKATTTSSPARAAEASIMAVSKVEFYIDDTRIAEDTDEPYETAWDTTSSGDGAHTIKAVAYNVANQASEDEITVQVVNIPPEIMLNRTRLNFGSFKGAGTTSDKVASTDLFTGSQVILVNNRGGGTLNWTVSKDAEWLNCTPGTGTGPGAVEVSIDPGELAGLAPGTYTAAIAFQDPNASNSPQIVPVTLKVYSAGTTVPPFGYFETPTGGSTVMSSIPVTGWALDDIEVSSVKIYRAPIPGHETGGPVYIGEAVFVDGARPDVEQTFPDYPKNYQAGWGYMMLTNFLPNQGNGTFTLYAKAMDKEGHEVTLGSKTITCDNANAVKPFGAIDTPGQGGIASGSSYVNFGWALTPHPNTIPTDGSTITVWVDGVPLGSPVYNRYREDIATLFPGYNNSNGAVGYFYLDTRAYVNGVHTISWSAEDNAGNKNGIGSRYFTILNVSDVSGAVVSTLKHKYKNTNMDQHISYNALRQAKLSEGPVYVKKGYDRNSPWQTFYPDSRGIITVGLKEDERIEMLISPGSSTYGYMMVGEQQRLLPLGSTLDSANGIFYWQVGPAFFGQHWFVFIEKVGNGQVKKKIIKVMISTKY